MLETSRSLENNLFYLSRRIKESDGKEKNTYLSPKMNNMYRLF